MPKVIDHAARRREVSEAAWRVIARDGAAGATVRAIAKEMGCSTGVLAHYFEGKNAILLQAHLIAYARVKDRIEQTRGDRRGIAALRHSLLEALPLDENRLLEARVEIAAWNGAITDPALAEAKERSLGRWRAHLYELISQGRADGDIRTPLDDDLIVHQVLALVDALTAEAVVHPHWATPRRQLQLAEDLLGRLEAAASDRSR